ncbi:hypothetical protein M3D15_09895 [Pseudoclavibacter alba]|uniref:GerMN domain-containing protein n=1 Tax=Pseudoclavibacter albus TaxID=272241 RepID=A0ABT2HZA2_9MICO|nr:hypothetical protein [Pseudoclavibacter alba]MCT2043634.1 hypothetical protein [Pseudoclavibacter alba]
MRTAVRVLAACALLAVGAGTLCGCSDDDVTVDPHVQAVDDMLKQIDGVTSVATDGGDSSGNVHLTVNLAEKVSPDALAEVARATKQFVDTPLTGAPAGATVRAELVRGNASYSYFEPGAVADVERQVSYWSQLSTLGFSSVRIDTLDAFIAGPDTSSTPEGDAAAGDVSGSEANFASDANDAVGDAAVGSSSASPSPSPSPAESVAPEGETDTPRYVHLDTPSSMDIHEAASLIESARDVVDPGAGAGAWDLTLFDGRVRGEFLTPEMPSVQDVDRLASFGSELAKLEGENAIHIVESPNGATERRAELALFNDELSDHSTETIEDAFLESSSDRAVEDILGTLDDSADSWRLSVMGSPLTGANNFEFAVEVNECVFHGDDNWQKLSDHLGNVWLAHRAGSDQRSVATGRCHVSHGVH